MSDNYNTQKILLDFYQANLDKKAVIYNEQSITYSEFRNQVISLADEIKQLGIKKNDFVVIYMSNSIEMVISVFAKALIAGTSHDLDSLHIQRYLNKFCYRFNRRMFEGQGFFRLLDACASCNITTYDEIT